MQFSEFIKNEFDVFYKDEINKFLSDGYKPLLNKKSLILFIQTKLNEFDFDYKIKITKKPISFLNNIIHGFTWE